MELAHRLGLAQKPGPGLVVDEHAAEVFQVVPDQHPVLVPVERVVIIIAAHKPDTVSTHRLDLHRHHQKPEVVLVHARPPARSQDLARAETLDPCMGPLGVLGHPAPDDLQGFADRGDPAPVFLQVDLLVQLLVAEHVGGLVLDGRARVGRHQPFQLVERAEKTFDRFALGIIRPGEKGLDP